MVADEVVARQGVRGSPGSSEDALKELEGKVRLARDADPKED